MISLSDLIVPKSKDAMLAVLLERLRGFSGITHTGTGVGTLAITSDAIAPDAARAIVVVVSGSGATFDLWIDGVLAISGSPLVTTSDVDLGALDARLTGVVVRFSDSMFVAGESYAFATTVPSFPTTSWESDSVPRAILETEADALADLSTQIANVASGGILDLSSGDWLTLLAHHLYGRDRYASTPTRGNLTLTNPAGAGSISISAGQLWAMSNAGLRYTNTAAATLPAGPSTLSLAFAAERPGAAYNTVPGQIQTLVTSLPGVTVTNGSGWITTQGTDTESDALLRQRCRDAWASIGAGSTAATYELWAREATSEITRVLANPDPSIAGRVDVLIAGPAGAVSSGTIATVLAYLLQRIPLCTDLDVESATNVPVALAGTVFVTGGAAGEAAARAAISAAMIELGASVPIRGTLYQSQIEGAIQDAANVRNVDLTSPTIDTPMGSTGVPVIDPSGLSYTQVSE